MKTAKHPYLLKEGVARINLIIVIITISVLLLQLLWDRSTNFPDLYFIVEGATPLRKKRKKQFSYDKKLILLDFMSPLYRCVPQKDAARR